MNKRVLIVLLVGLNLFLLGGLILSAYTPPAAFAQAAGRRGEYTLVSARILQGNDAIFLLDTVGRQLHAFRTPYPHNIGQPVAIAHVASRDLSHDFGPQAKEAKP